MAKKRPKIDLSQPVQPRTGALERLFETEEDAAHSSGLQLLSIRLEAIDPDPGQPRRVMPDESLQELSESIKQDGVIQPIEVTEVGQDRYLIVHGERRWRAALLAGLETIPAVVRRQDYDALTRFVRQLVENIQREDLNDVDRAAGLLHLRDLMQSELDAQEGEEKSPSPWARTITWSKVGKRLGYSRQRIHQLIRLLDLPEEIKQDVRDGKLSERETRIYQGLKAKQQRDLHRARLNQELTPVELRSVAGHLKNEPTKSVKQAISAVRRPPPPVNEQALETSFENTAAISDVGEEDIVYHGESVPGQPWVEADKTSGRRSRATNIDRLNWVRGHLARVTRHDLELSERLEILRLLSLIQQDVASLLNALRQDRERDS